MAKKNKSQETTQVEVGNILYSLTSQNINTIGERLRKKFNTNEEGLTAVLISHAEGGENRPHQMSYHQNGCTCGYCIKLTLDKGCSYKDAVITNLTPKPENQEKCSWYTFFRLAYKSGLLDICGKKQVR